jgi:hypothetical protein
MRRKNYTIGGVLLQTSLARLAFICAIRDTTIIDAAKKGRSLILTGDQTAFLDTDPLDEFLMARQMPYLCDNICDEYIIRSLYLGHETFSITINLNSHETDIEIPLHTIQQHVLDGTLADKLREWELLRHITLPKLTIPKTMREEAVARAAIDAWRVSLCLQPLAHSLVLTES